MNKLTTKQKRGSQSHRRGQRAETWCRWLLHFKLYRILVLRYKTKLGEIDIIAARGRSLVFIEVKARPDRSKAASAISPQQQKRLSNAAQAFIAQNPQYAGFYQRFDVMLVTPWCLPIHLKNAF